MFTSLALWKHHVNLLFQIFQSERARILINANNTTYLNSHVPFIID